MKNMEFIEIICKNTELHKFKVKVLYLYKDNFIAKNKYGCQWEVSIDASMDVLMETSRHQERRKNHGSKIKFPSKCSTTKAT